MNDCEGCPLQGNCDLTSLRNNMVRGRGVSHLPDGFVLTSPRTIENVDGVGPSALQCGKDGIVTCVGSDGLPLNQSVIHPVGQMDFPHYSQTPFETAFGYYGRTHNWGFSNSRYCSLPLAA